MWLELLKSALTKQFGKKLKEILSSLGKTIIDFSEEYEIPEGTLYKIISEEDRDFRRSTLIQIINAVKSLEGYKGENFIGIITVRSALDSLGKNFQIKGKTISADCHGIFEYS